MRCSSTTPNRASLGSFGALFASLAGMGNHLERRDSAAALQRAAARNGGLPPQSPWPARLDDERATAAGQALIERVVEAQHWRPTSWKVAAEEINYRRFFDINGLAGLRMEHAATFADAHQFTFSLLERGAVDGTAPSITFDGL